MADKLEAYHEKRDFSRTTEPTGEAVEAEDGLRFVVQHHLASRDHYDLRLEWDGALESFAVPKGPSFDPRDKRLAVQVEAHPLEYRHFEGTIPRGEYGGGTVMLWDEGFWEPDKNAAEGLESGVLKFTLFGKRLRGKWALIRLKRKAGEKQDNWLLRKEKDAYAKEGSDLSEYDVSISTGRTMTQIQEGQEDRTVKNPFTDAAPMLLKLVDQVPDGEDWLYELKYDGYRILAYLEGGGATLKTRSGSDYTSRFRSVASSLSDWSCGRAMVLDGEMTVTDPEGKTDFQALQNYLKNPKAHTLTYIVFDLLALDGADLREHSLIDRKQRLEALMKDAPKNLHFSSHVQGNGKESFAAACRAHMEGIVGKRAGSVYSGTRNGDWIKLKCGKRQTFLIGGYTRSAKRTEGVSALLLGAYENGTLEFLGRVGTGLTASDMKELETKCAPLQKDASPFHSPPKPKPGEATVWLEPVLAAEISFAEWTKAHLFRHASYKGLVTNIDPKNVMMDGADDTLKEPEPPEAPKNQAAGQETSTLVGGVKITNPDKVLFEDPVITKGEVIRYYAQVAERMLPYVGRRILSIVRCPKGISQTCFYKKHPGPDSKGIVPVPVCGSDGKTEEYFYIEDASGLISEAQMGTLEFHIWGSRVEDPEKPDLMVFDLDPDEGMELNRVRQGVSDLKSILSELSLLSYLKTSGGKGYHVVLPFEPSVSWDMFKGFAQRVAEVMERKWSDRYTSNVRKVKRSDRIFIDWIRNGRGATSIAPYSLRARKGAKISMPLAWDELHTVAPDGVSMTDALLRIKKADPWSGFFTIKQKLR